MTRILNYYNEITKCHFDLVEKSNLTGSIINDPIKCHINSHDGFLHSVGMT